ncbi:MULTISPECIES: SGNH/GDSL hydrolase family protein [unclassified Pseudomonas]|uniref:SGNH/GDSL hydrolase family protein n=1 Tax=unclassified Pseudomonas TaxID=196821 RepID=UPI0035C10FFC
MRYSLITLAFTAINANAAVAVAPDGAKIQPEFTTCEYLECGHYVSSKFYMQERYLSGGAVRGETFFANPSTERTYKTAFKPNKILSIYNHTTGQFYRPGEDYIETSSGFAIPDGSKIKFAPEGFVESISPDDQKNYGVRLTTEYQGYQYSVDYLTAEKFKTESYGSLGNFSKKLGSQPVSITFFGDSITDGANATGSDAPPHQPGYAGLIAARLSELYPMLIKSRNNSVGGWSAINATASVEYRVNDRPSDLVILAFGMNDGGGYSPKEYRKHLKYVIDAIRAKQPDTAILLVSPTRANPASIIQKPEYIDGYIPELAALAKEYKSVATVNMTAVWDRLLLNKNYYDITGNGLNHPNDFGHRIIAEVVLNAILEP